MRLASTCRRIGGVVALCLCAVGTLVRLTVRDSVAGAAVFFYALPPGVMAALCAVGAAAWWRGPRRGAMLSLLLSIGYGLWWRHSAWVHNDLAAPAFAPIRVALWNTGHGVGGWDGMSATLASLGADVIGLVEAGRDAKPLEALLARTFPEHVHVDAGREMHLLVRGGATLVEKGSLSKGSRYRVFDASVRGFAFGVVLVDIASNPFVSRREALSSLTGVGRQGGGRPIVVMGDFNTPTDSALLADFRRDFANAFEAAGNGYAPTWPIPLPLLAIDQVWVNAGFQVTACSLGWSWRSDHRPVVADVLPRTANGDGVIARRPVGPLPPELGSGDRSIRHRRCVKRQP